MVEYQLVHIGIRSHKCRHELTALKNLIQELKNKVTLLNNSIEVSSTFQVHILKPIRLG